MTSKTKIKAVLCLTAVLSVSAASADYILAQSPSYSPTPDSTDMTYARSTTTDADDDMPAPTSTPVDSYLTPSPTHKVKARKTPRVRHTATPVVSPTATISQ